MLNYSTRSLKSLQSLKSANNDPYSLSSLNDGRHIKINTKNHEIDSDDIKTIKNICNQCNLCNQCNSSCQHSDCSEQSEHSKYESIVGELNPSESNPSDSIHKNNK